MSQNIINTGQAANDGTGEPLRQAFTAINNNFSQIWSSGPVNSNVQITDNKIVTLQTNQNLVLAPNGIGLVETNTSVIPAVDSIYDLGSFTHRWDTVWTHYIDISGPSTFNDLTVQGNLVVNGDIIEMGNIVTDSKTIQLANTAANASAANGSGITVGANDTIATFLYDSANNQWIINIGISANGNIVAPYFVGSGSQLTNIDANNVTGLANVAYTGSYNDLINVPAPYNNANVTTLLSNFGANTITLSGNIESGNIVPGIDNYYTLGNATNQWNTLYSKFATIESFNANVNFGTNWINDLSDPVQPQDAATKNYVDTVAQGLHVHTAAYLATTTDLATYTGATVTYSQPAGYGNGVGATLSLTGNTLNSLDGVTLIGSNSNTRLLIKNEDNAVYNGIYTYTSNVVLTRSTDADEPGNLDGGDFIFVQAGTTQADTGWAQTTDNVIIGTSNVVFTQFSGAGTYQAGNGLTLSGTVFSVNVDNSTTQIVAGNIAVKNVPVNNITGLGSYLASYTGDISTSGNITGANIIGNGSQLLNLLGSNVVGDVAGANHANVADVANSVSGSNVVGDVAGANHANVADVANSVSGSNVVGQVGNALVAGTVYTNAQPNITSVGTLTSVTSTGNIQAGNLRTTGLISATGNITGNYIFGNGSQLTGISSATVLSGNLSGNLQGNGFGANNFSFLSATGNVTGGNIVTSGLISATGNIIGGNIAMNGTLGTTGVMSAGAFVTTGALTPVTLTATTDNWNPPGLSTCLFLRAAATTNVSLTGIQAPSPAANQMIFFLNLGPGNINLVRNNPGSAAANRFLNNNDVLLNSNECVVMMYDAISLGWRIFGIQN